ncbi:MAG: hypothetical protein F4Z34_06775 [Acidimicrobiaceae bacterium]|nr:hypothetical protein [Acidimicrobiaceae bacterium]
MTSKPPAPAIGARTHSRRDCESVSDVLAAVAGGDRAYRPAELDHLSSCLRCRVEESRYRRLMDAMRLMRDAPVPADSRLESQILVHLDRYGHRRAWDTRPRFAATVAAGAAAAAGLIAFTARHRRAARLAS